MQDEPRAHRSFLIASAACAVGAVPFWFVGRETFFVFGVPLWLWTSLLFAVGLSGLTVWGIVRLWRDDDRD